MPLSNSYARMGTIEKSILFYTSNLGIKLGSFTFMITRETIKNVIMVPRLVIHLSLTYDAVNVDFYYACVNNCIEGLLSYKELKLLALNEQRLT